MANPAIERITENYNGGYSSSSVTLDSVVQKTTATVGTVSLFALATWVFLDRAITGGNQEAFATVAMLAFVASLATFGLSLFISFRQSTSPALILLFAALEGVVIGFISKATALQVGSNEPVYGAVLGTFVTAAATLAVYKFFNIQVTSKMRKYVTIAVFAFIGISFVDLGLYFLGASIGVNEFGPMGFLFSLVGLVIALFMLITDFDAVERAIEHRMPEAYSWTLAFCLTVSLVWIYVNLLRMLAILRGSD